MKLCSPRGRATGPQLDGVPLIVISVQPPRGLLMQAKGRDLQDGAESLDQVWNRAADCWQHAIKTVQQGHKEGQQPYNIVIVGHSILTAAILGHCLGLGQESMSLFKADCGGVTVVEFPREVTPEAGVVQCINYTAHLGRWSVPITDDDLDSICGIEGCF